MLAGALQERKLLNKLIKIAFGWGSVLIIARFFIKYKCGSSIDLINGNGLEFN